VLKALKFEPMLGSFSFKKKKLLVSVLINIQKASTILEFIAIIHFFRSFQIVLKT
jgi:hypothetical protein